MKFKIVYSLLFYVFYVSCEIDDACNFHTCGECIGSAHDICVWCSKVEMKDRRCMPITEITNSTPMWCDGNYVNPQPLQNAIINTEFNKSVQLRPQRIKIKTRPGVEVPFPIKFQPAEDYPLDVYYLIDISHTMRSAKEDLQHQAQEIYKQLTSYTNNVQLGIGSFVEKPGFPLVDVYRTIGSEIENNDIIIRKLKLRFVNIEANQRLIKKIILYFYDTDVLFLFTTYLIQTVSYMEIEIQQQRPTRELGGVVGQHTDVPLSYSFKNLLSLTKDMKRFKSIMEKIQFGANYDDPEAGLDALMQAMVCRQELGWRKDARRIIVLCTDSTYHSAGDGRIVGAIKPNDMQCHLEDNFYNQTMSLTYDYPSISQINKVASDGKFKIVFATKIIVSTEYTLLAHDIIGAKFAGLEGGTDAVKIIKEAYLEHAMKAKLYYKLPSYIQLMVDQDCDTKPAKNCESTPEQRNVTIGAKLLVKYCPPVGERKHELVVNAIGIQDNVTIELDIDCQCDCEKEIGAEINSEKCHNAGFIQCGICKCNPGRYGVDCRCNGTSSYTNDMEKCKLDPDDKKLCSGRGTCRCGKCEECNKGFSGDFCQFDNTACPRKNKVLCSNNGICTQGKCQCNSLWSGNDCSCTLMNTPCITPYSKKVCSGQGKCVCGQCECDKLPEKDGTYTGRYCDMCDDCGEQRCKELEEYVLCNIIKNKPLCDEQFNSTDTLVYFLNSTEMHGPDWSMAQYCKKQLDNDSIIIFKYKYNDRNIELGIQKELELAPKADVLIAVGAALGVVLLIGILTLIIWKILIDMHDKKEYEKFAKESTANGFEVYCNDLYQPPGSTFRNPAFERS